MVIILNLVKKIKIWFKRKQNISLTNASNNGMAMEGVASLQVRPVFIDCKVNKDIKLCIMEA